MRLFVSSLCLVLCGTSALAASDGSLADTNIRYIGRWDHTESDVCHGYWSGVYLRTIFTGTAIGIKLKEATGLAVSIDGEPPRSVSAGGGVTKLNASPLKPGDHHLQVGSAGQNYEVAFQGLVLDSGAITKPVDERPIIEFIGDSITQGNGAYSWLSAVMLGCDHVQVAFSGVALTSGYGCSSKIGLDAQYFRLKNYNHVKDNPQAPWDFSYTPRFVVINLGQNDQCGSESNDTMTTSYMSFVRNIRAKFPLAHIVAMRPFGGPYAQAERKAIEALAAAGDARVHYIDTTGWLAKDDFLDGIHPNADGSLKAAWRVASAIWPLMQPTN